MQFMIVWDWLDDAGVNTAICVIVSNIWRSVCADTWYSPASIFDKR